MAKKILTSLDLLTLPNLTTPTSGSVGFGAKSDGLYQKIGAVETRLSVDGHTHPISGITGLQTALNSKLETSIFNTHNNDNVRHITGAERTKWNKVVTDFAGLEIGGRNLLKGTNFDTIKRYEHNNQAGERGLHFDSNALVGLIQNETYTISVGLRGDIPRNIIIDLRSKSGDGWAKQDIALGSNLSIDTFKKFSLTFSNPYNELAYLRIYSRYTTSPYTGWFEIEPSSVKLEKGNKPTDWTPAPEDQVSDWLTTDVNSFSFIKNKPTTLAGYGITDAYTKTQVDSSLNLKLNKLTFDDLFEKVETSAGKWAVKVKYNLFSVGEISAFGAEESEGGGGIINILSQWANYDTSKSGWALSAGLGVDLNTRKADKIWVESLLENYTPTDTTYTAGRGLTLTGTVFSTSFDIASYATVTALGGKVDKVTGKSLISDGEITRLAGVTNQTRASLNITNVDNTSDANKPISSATQTALNSKLETSIFNAHNTDNVRHITGAERTKWNTVVSDFGNLEIGGRNLWTNSRTIPATVVIGQYGYSSGFKNILGLGLRTGELMTFSIYVSNIPAGESVRARIDFFRPDGTYSDAQNTQYSISSEGVAYISISMQDTSEFDRIRYRVMPVNYTANYQVDVVHEKLERGNKPTDWTPAPEDQVSDWNTTDVNSFSFIKNKPTLLSQFTDNIGIATHITNTSNPHSVTKAQVGLGNVTNESKATMFTNPTFTGTTKVTILELNTNWKFVKVGNNIELQFDGVTKQIMTNNGDIIATAGVTAYQ